MEDADESIRYRSISLSNLSLGMMNKRHSIHVVGIEGRMKVETSRGSAFQKGHWLCLPRLFLLKFLFLPKPSCHHEETRER